MSFGINFGGGRGIGVGEDIPKDGGSSGPSFIASLLDLIGLHHQVGAPTKDQSQKASEKPAGGAANRAAKSASQRTTDPSSGSDAESRIEDAAPGEEPEMGPHELAGVHAFLNSFDSVLGTARQQPQVGSLIPPLPPKQPWGLQTMDLGNGFSTVTNRMGF